MDAWWKRLSEAYFSRSLGSDVVGALHRLIAYDNPPGPLGDAFYGGFYSYVQKDLRDLLARRLRGRRRRAVTPRRRYSRIFCAGGTLRSCRALLASTLRDAVGDVQRRYGSADPAAWRVPVLCAAGQSPPACDQIEFTTAGAIDTPPIPWQNRGTFQQAVEVTGG